MNEVTFSAQLSARKMGSTVSGNLSGSRNMLGSDMCYSTQNITTTAAALTFDSVAGAPTKLLIANLEPASYYGISGVPTISAAGTGYQVGDVLTVLDGTGIAATVTVSSIGTGGAITGLTLTFLGKYSVVPSSPSAVTGGHGTGASLALATVTFSGASVTIAGDAGMTNFPQLLPPGDVILLSPTSATIYAKSSSGAVEVLKVATEA